MRANNMVEVRIVKDAYLPRFTMKKGELWTVRKNKVTTLGFPLGGGFIESHYFEVIK
jgi:hypothetical protein